MSFKDYEKKLSPSYFHAELAKKAAKQLAFSPNLAFDPWRKKLRRKFKDLIGPVYKDTGAVKFKVLEEKNTGGHTVRKIVFPTTPESMNIGYLLAPNTGKKRYPAMVCLQGHSPGAHLSVGKYNNNAERERIKAKDSDYAVQAVKNGFVALAVEQRCFGEREERLLEKMGNNRCWRASMSAFILGHTILAERIADISRSIDLLRQLSFVDGNRIGCMGNSGGGTAAYYAACIDKRINIAVPSCSFGTYEDAKIEKGHCMCSYIPGALKYFGMEDLAGLIAPRHLIIIAGRQDPIIPASGVTKAYRKSRMIYRKAGASDRIKLAVGPEGHRFYASLAWPLINRALNDI